MNADRFADILANAGVIDAAAVSDPEGYDNGATMARVRAAFWALCLARNRNTAQAEPTQGAHECGGAWHRYGIGFRCDCGAFRQ